MANSKPPVTVSASSVGASSSTPLPQNLVNDITTALLTANAIPRIQAVLNHELAATGWTANLRSFVLQLLRSGECTTYDELMERVLEEVRSKPGQQMTEKSINGVNGTGNSKVQSGKSVDEGGLLVPDKAVREGIKVVRKELEGVCEIVLDG
jgi:hypothetical protein